MLEEEPDHTDKEIWALNVHWAFFWQRIDVASIDIYEEY